MPPRPTSTFCFHGSTDMPMRIVAFVSPCLPAVVRYSFERGQQTGHQAAAFDQAVDFDMLVQRVRVGPTQAEAVQRRDPHGAGKIRVGAAARAAMSNVDAALSRNFASLCVELERRGV